jgi:hypothetical protein
MVKDERVSPGEHHTKVITWVVALMLLGWWKWPAPGSEDTELGVLMEPEVGHGETEVHAGVQA